MAKASFRDANLTSIKSFLPLLGKENVIGYVVNQEHLDSLDIRLIKAVLNEDGEEGLPIDTLKNIIKQNNWRCGGALELYLKCKKFYGYDFTPHSNVLFKS